MKMRVMNKKKFKQLKMIFRSTLLQPMFRYFFNLLVPFLFNPYSINSDSQFLAKKRSKEPSLERQIKM